MSEMDHAPAAGGPAISGLGSESSFTMGRDFERGVEFGLLYARVHDYGRTETTVHADLAEQVMRAAERHGKPFRAQPHEHDAECRPHHDDEDWLDVTIGSLPEEWAP